MVWNVLASQVPEKTPIHREKKTPTPAEIEVANPIFSAGRIPKKANVPSMEPRTKEVKIE